MQYYGFNSRIDWPTAEVATLIALGALPKGGRVLDLGAGHGTEALQFAIAGYDVTVVESDPLARRALRARMERIPRMLGSVGFGRGANSDVFRFRSSEPFDLVLDRLCVNNMGTRNQCRCIRTAARALRLSEGSGPPNGGLYFIRNMGQDGGPLGSTRLVESRKSALASEARSLLRTYFGRVKEVPFAGLLSPCDDDSPDTLTIKALPMTVIALRRNEIAAV